MDGRAGAQAGAGVAEAEAVVTWAQEESVVVAMAVAVGTSGSRVAGIISRRTITAVDRSGVDGAEEEAVVGITIRTRTIAAWAEAQWVWWLMSWCARTGTSAAWREVIGVSGHNNN